MVAADPEQAENAVQGRAHVVAYAAEEVGPRPRRAVRLGERGLELLLVLLFCGDRVVDIHEDADGGVGEAVLVAAELRGVAHPDVAARLGPNPVRDVIGRGPGPCDGAGCLRRRGGYIRGKLPHELHAQQRVRLTLVVGLEALDRPEPAGLAGATRASEAQAATRNDRSRVASPSTADATKPSMVAVAFDFMNEYADTFDELSK